jgi:predicted DNA-binding transcriptional regulator AlpA
MPTLDVPPQEVPEDLKLLTPSQAAEILGFHRRTLDSWRRLGKGPQFVRRGYRAVGYRASELRAFVERERADKQDPQ